MFADIRKHKINLRLNAPVVALTGERGAFEVTTADGRTIAAEHVVLATGTQGNLRRLAIPGADPDRVQYQPDDPDAYLNTQESARTRTKTEQMTQRGQQHAKDAKFIQGMNAPFALLLALFSPFAYCAPVCAA